MTKLKDYLVRNNLSQADFADRLGVRQASVSRWASGQRTPDWAMIPGIYEATDGELDANSFVELPDVKEK